MSRAQLGITKAPSPPPAVHGELIRLPAPKAEIGNQLEQCIRLRRSCRQYTRAPLELADAAQLLWAAQGVTGKGGLRAAPSAGAVYPLRTYLIAGTTTGVAAGVYRYDPDEHTISTVSHGDIRRKLVRAMNGQECIADSAAVILFAARMRRMTTEFGERAPRLMHLEAGHAAQNICLQATALGLGVLTMGAFDEAALSKLIGLPDIETPVYLVAIGHR